MKFTVKSLDHAINFLLPNIKKAKENGINFNRPQLIQSIAMDYFVHSLDRNWDPSYDERIAYHIVQCAAKDLSEYGYFEFGEIDHNFE